MINNQLNMANKLKMARSFGAAAAFSPSDIAGLALRLKSDTATFQLAACATAAGGGDPVGCWQDQSANTNNATQSTSGSKPTRNNNAINSLPEIAFDNTDDQMDVAAHASLENGEVTIFAVWQSNTTSPAADHPVFNKKNTNSGTVRLYLATATDKITARVRLAADPGTPIDIAANAVVDGAFHYYTMRYASGAFNLWVDGAVQTDSDATAGAIDTTNTDIIAVGNSPTVSKPGNGNLAELIWYDSALSTGDRANVESYLASEYSL